MNVEQIIAEIADRCCGVATLDERHSDDLDFHEVSVWDLRAALSEAFQAGAQVPAGSGR